MVKFGNRLEAEQLQEWKEYYIDYNQMKEELKIYREQSEHGNRDRRQVIKAFSKLLDDQIEKVVLFMLEQQGTLAKRLEKLAEQREAIEDMENIHKRHALRDGYRAVGKDLIKLLNFVEMNAVGVRKILKKFDKQFGYKFTNQYLSSRSDHPYSQLRQVFRHVGIGAVVGAISRNLTDIQRQERSYINIYDQPSAIVTDPIIDSINETIDRLTNSTNFLSFLGQRALITQEEIPRSEDEFITRSKYNVSSLLLNLISTFLYMVNTYIIVPTADNYSVSLGASATVCGVIIGSMPVTSIFSALYFSAWSNKSYFLPLLFSTAILLIGNILYAVAYDFNSMAILLIGRLLCGMGSARAVNRRYISDCVPNNMRLLASAAFVCASALGMACGPALAGLLQIKFKIYFLTFNEDTLPGWVMAIGWFAYMIWLCISFQEPSHDIFVPSLHGESTSGTIEDEMDNGLTQKLLNSEHKQNEDEDDDENSEGSHKPVTSLRAAYRLLTPSVKVQMLICFMLKYAMELLLSESSVVTSYYFSWNTSSVAVFLFILGLTVLPVNMLVGTYVSNLFEDRQILLVSEIFTLVGIMLSFQVTSSYTVPQYVSAALITFVSAEVLEGVNLAVLSRVMSPRLSRGTYNNGLLTTEAGTIARVIADATITLAGFLGQDKLLNITMLPSLLICVASIAATMTSYKSLGTGL